MRNRVAQSLSARQTAETASYHKSVSHIPNGYLGGWVSPLPKLSLGRQKQSLEIRYFIMCFSWWPGPTDSASRRAGARAVKQIWQGGDLPMFLLCRVSLNKGLLLLKQTSKQTKTPKNPKVFIKTFTPLKLLSPSWIPRILHILLIWVKSTRPC